MTAQALMTLNDMIYAVQDEVMYEGIFDAVKYVAGTKEIDWTASASALEALLGPRDPYHEEGYVDKLQRSLSRLLHGLLFLLDDQSQFQNNEALITFTYEKRHRLKEYVLVYKFLVHRSYLQGHGYTPAFDEMPRAISAVWNVLEHQSSNAKEEKKIRAAWRKIPKQLLYFCPPAETANCIVEAEKYLAPVVDNGDVAAPKAEQMKTDV